MPLPSRKRTRTNEYGSYRSGSGPGGRTQRKAGPRGPTGQYYSDRARNSRGLSRSVNACNKLSGTGVVSAISGAAVTLLKAKLGLNTEEKNVDFAFVSSFCTNVLTPFVHVLSTPIPLGDSNANRNGNGVRMTGYQLSLAVRNSNLNTYALGTYVRIIGVDWGNNPGSVAQPNNVDILKVNTDILSPYNDSPNLTPKKIVYDQEFHLGSMNQGVPGVSTAGADPMMRRADIMLAPINHHLKWSDADTLGTFVQMTEGLIQFYAMASGYVGAAPSIDMYQRISYVDN